MGWWDELEASLTAKLDDFLRAHPDLAAEMEQDTLAEQETQTRQLLQQLQGETQTLEQKILATGEQIRLWHERLALAERAGRQDLIHAAKMRQGILMTQGNQYWAELTVAKKRIQQLQALLTQIQSKRQQVQPQTDSSSGYQTPDRVEKEFRNLELEREFEQLKRDMGRK
jgi:uncharacterized protein (TIGR04376 family)